MQHWSAVAKQIPSQQHAVQVSDVSASSLPADQQLLSSMQEMPQKQHSSCQRRRLQQAGVPAGGAQHANISCRVSA
jgi:hypothetical protein